MCRDNDLYVLCERAGSYLLVTIDLDTVVDNREPGAKGAPLVLK